MDERGPKYFNEIQTNYETLIKIMLYFSFSNNFNDPQRPSFRLLLSVRCTKNDRNLRQVHNDDKKRTDGKAARVEVMILEM